VKLAQSIVQNFNLPTETVWVRVDLVLAHSANLPQFEELVPKAIQEAFQELKLEFAGVDFAIRYQRLDEFGIPVALFIPLAGYLEMNHLQHLVLRNLILLLQQTENSFPHVLVPRKSTRGTAA
jgi:small-conductance mechanosensitive channel